MSDAECPLCSASALAHGWVVNLELRGGAELDGILCSKCGNVYVDDPNESIRDAYQELDEEVERT